MCPNECPKCSRCCEVFFKIDLVDNVKKKYLYCWECETIFLNGMSIKELERKNLTNE
jgi:hypothetical protein